MAREFYIRDFLKRIKRPVDLESEREYKLVTIKMNHKGVILRELKKGASIKSKMYEVREGDFILSGIDARNGAFGIVPKELGGAIVTNDFWYFEINEEIISKQLFLELTATSWFDEICKRGSDGTTQRIRLQKDKFFNQKVLLPEGEEQEELLSKILTFKKGKSDLENEIRQQKELVARLKQSILQEAILGKLTVDWREQNPNAEPAGKLLDRIKSEKDKLIRDKKIRKEKPLPTIAYEAVPFELPQGWVWCRLGEICSKTGSGSTPKGGRSAYPSTGIKFLRSQNVYDDGLRYDGLAFISKRTHEKMKGTQVLAEDLLLNITGGSIGRCCIVPKDFDEGNINQHIAIIRTVDSNIRYFIHKVICSPYFQREIIKVQTGAGREGLPKNKMDQVIIALPPCEEQNAIVQKVEGLLEKCRTLESEITQSEERGQILMQAVLKETFENKITKTSGLGIMAEFEAPHGSSSTSSIPSNKKGFAKLVLAGKIICECKDSREFTNIKFQKLQHLAEHLMEVDLNLNYYNQAAGPYDNRFMHTLHNKMSQQKWFVSQGHKYSSMEKASEIDGHFHRYFAAKNGQFTKLIKLLANATENQCEIISTLYAVWNDRIIKGEFIENNLLIEDFFAWSERKQKYETKQLNDAIQWMKENELEPTGFGELIKHAKKKKKNN